MLIMARSNHYNSVHDEYVVPNVIGLLYSSFRLIGLEHKNTQMPRLKCTPRFLYICHVVSDTDRKRSTSKTQLKWGINFIIS